MSPRPPYLARIDTHRVQLMQTEAWNDVPNDPTRTFRPADDADDVAFHLRYCGWIVAVVLVSWAVLDPLGLLKTIGAML